jgi:uncharacterized protein involved in exopolysaccharide biosynthesis
LNQEGTPPHVAQNGDDLWTLAANLWRYKWVIIVMTVVGAMAFGAIGAMTTPVYRATTVLIPTFNERGSLGGAIGAAAGQLGGLASLVGIDVNSQDAATEEALAVLRSRRFVERFIEDHQLLPLLYPKSWDGQARAWLPGKEPTTASGAKAFSERVVHVDQDKKTGLVTTYVDWTDRNLAAEWANEIVGQLNEEMRKRAIDHATSSLEFLNKELATTTTLETRQAINHLIESQVKQRMLSSVSPEYVFRVVDPALPPDVNDQVRPRRATLLIIGILLGFSMGFAIVFVRSSLPSTRRR